MQINQCRQQGSALITALFITALVAIAATAISTRLQLDIYRARLAVLSDKLYFASQGVTFWAMGELADTNNKFTLSDSSAKVLELKSQFSNQYPEFKISGSLYDLQARFNLNNLSDKRYRASFLKLLDTTTKLSASEKEDVLMATLDWIDSYRLGRGQDRFVSYYLQQKPPYYASHQQFHDLSEFRLIKNVNAGLYHALSPYLIALPEITPININTSSKRLLRTLANGLTKDQVDEIKLARKDTGIQDIKDIAPLLTKLNIRNQQVTTESQYFLCVAKIAHADLNLTSSTILKRHKNNNGKITVSIVSQRLN